MYLLIKLNRDRHRRNGHHIVR